MNCVSFLQDVLPSLHMRWPGFRKVRGQVCKRISRRYRALGLASLEDYRRYLDANPGEWTVLDGMCRVTISRFYRDRGVFDAIRDSVLPALLSTAKSERRDLVKVWSCGCASGEEGYSVSLCFQLAAAGQMGTNLEIVGTDADPRMLERAKRGVYPKGALKELPFGWRESAFEPSESEWRIRERFREGTTWFQQDIRSGAPDGLFDLILCRNLVFIYFDEARQQECLGRMLECLRPAGFLVIGKHDTLPDHSFSLSAVDSSRTIFKREA